MYVALLRGINVGGRCLLPMKELAAIFAASGASRVRTYIQSGNVVFEASDAEQVVGRVTPEIKVRYGYPGHMVLRSRDELTSAFASNPFVQAGAAIDTLHVYFLNARPDAAAVSSLDPERSPGDSYVVMGQEVYLQLLNGMARTKLTNLYFDHQLKTVSTARNWKTVTKLVGMMGEAKPGTS